MRLIYISPVPWHSFAQRPHKFVEWFHANGGSKVLWIEPYPTRLPKWSDFRQLRSRAKSFGNQPHTPHWLTITRPAAFPIEPLPGGATINRLMWQSIFVQIDTFCNGYDYQLVIGKPSEFAVSVLARHANAHSTYDAMDDFPAFYFGLSRAAMIRNEKKIAAKVTQITASSTLLAERFASLSHKTIRVTNACDVSSLPPIGEWHDRSATPVLGYVGTIGHWFDWDFIVSLAKANSSMIIRLIGPIHTPTPRYLPSNIEWFPACDHAMAISAMQKFSIGLIPFKQINLTASVDPIKYYEYRALGLPVLSTRFGEMALREGYPGVSLVDRDSDLAALVNSAMEFENDLDEIRIFRDANSWKYRFDSSNII